MGGKTIFEDYSQCLDTAPTGSTMQGHGKCQGMHGAFFPSFWEPLLILVPMLAHTQFQLGILAHAWNLSSYKAEMVGCKFEASLGRTVHFREAWVIEKNVVQKLKKFQTPSNRKKEEQREREGGEEKRGK